MASEIEELKRAIELAQALDQPEVEMAALKKLDQLTDSGVVRERPGERQERTNQAVTSAQPDYTAGLTFLGRGADNIVKGMERLALKGGEAMGMLHPELSRIGQEQLASQREREDAVYQPLKEKYGASATLGEFVGESAPFLNLPVLRAEQIPGAVGRMAERTFVGAPLRAAPEAALGAAQETSHYPTDPLASDGGRATEAAGAAGVMRLGTDYLARRANIRRGRMDEDVQEFYDIGAEEGVPVRRGTTEDQIGSAQAAGARRSTQAGDAALGAEAVGSLQTGMAAREGDFETAYGMLFGTMDEYGANPSRIKAKAQRLFETEKAHGTMANSDLMSEYRKWMDMPDEDLTIETLHKYRQDLRTRMRALPAESRNKAAQFQQLEDMVSREIHSEADRISPGLGDALKNIDNWYYEDIARIRRMPGVKGALAENPTPANFLNWMIGTPGPGKRAAFDALTPQGQKAVKEAMWNRAYKSGLKGKEFNPLQYAKAVEKQIESAEMFMEPEEVLQFRNLGKLMRHIAGEGKSADNNILRLIRGFPFMYRAVGDAVRRSNFRYNLSHAPPDIRPGSPEMERFYRGLIRSIAIQDEDTFQAAGEIPAQVGGAVQSQFPNIQQDTIGRLGIQRNR